MRNIISLMHMSLDGLVAGPNGEMDWIVVNEEISEDVEQLLRTVDTAIYGRVTYGMMESYWPTVPSNPSSTDQEIRHSRWVDNVHKVVISNSLNSVEWNNTQLVKEHIADEIAKLKRQPGQNMMIFGSPSIVHLFMQLGLIDEYRINVNPIILGSGIPFFKDVKQQENLKLLESKVYDTGVIGLYYRKI